LIQLKTFELKLDFAVCIQHTDVRIADVCWSPIYHLPGNVISAALIYVNMQPEHELLLDSFQTIPEISKK